MGATLSNLTEGVNGLTMGPGLGDIPESCVACVFMYLTPMEICNLARLNRAFRGAASSDAVWEAKLPPNYKDLLALLPPERYQSLSKKDIFALLSRPIPFDDGNRVLELESNEAAGYSEENDDNLRELEEPTVSWNVTFREQRQQIIVLWDVCHVSIIHRTQFYLLFKGDPADQIYMEVELRRMSWLQQHLAELGNASPAHVGDEPTISLSSSIRALKREREFLAKRLTIRLTAEERVALYIKWDVPLDGKQRKLQFINKLWTNPHDAKHIHESAEIVAQLVGFCESGNVSKEMFELNFVLPADKRPWI